jgi:sugar lactone lactonase YvrE
MAPLNDKDSTVRCIADVRAVLGEGPVWAEREQALYWLDIEGRKIFRLGASDEVEHWPAPFRICCIAPCKSGGFIAGTDRGLATIDLDSGRFDVFASPEKEIPRNRFNDGKVDRQGRFWAGTMDDSEQLASGSLYRIDPDLEWHLVDKDYRVTNGPAFTIDGTRMYVTDSALRTIYAFDLGDDGEARNRRVFASFGEEDGFPDGMTVDSEGFLWAAFWDGWCIRRLSPDGEVVRRIEMPVQRPTSCEFGGPALDRLYVTSARRGLDEVALQMQPCAGGLFLVDAGVHGIAPAPFAG